MSSNEPQPSTAFDRLDYRVQQFAWDSGWIELRDVQEKAIHAVLDSDADLAVIAPTAGGKTEAVFFPLATQLADAAVSGSVDVLYVSPLKALINDVEERLQPLLERLNIEIFRWHGDVAHASKRRKRDAPSGVMLTTPESIEALFMLHPIDARKMFANVRAIVMDEVHAFPGTERGRQLQSLLHRIDREVERRVRRIALSATVAEERLLCEFIRPADAANVRVVRSQRDGVDPAVKVLGFLAAPGDEPIERRVAEELSRLTDGTNNLIFVNRRDDAELYAQLLQQIAVQRGSRSRYVPHHGSLSWSRRDLAEKRMRDSAEPTTVICTSTLELGIDVGAVAAVGQIGCPPSVAALRQRVGRSGRRGSRPRLHVSNTQAAVGTRTPPHQQVRSDLVQTIAMIDLMRDSWFEPPIVDAFHWSTLIQQVLSTIAQRSGATESYLWRLLCETGPFPAVGRDDFGVLVQKLVAEKLLERTPGGELLIGQAGEVLTRSHEFYAAFTATEEYRVVTTGETIGSMPVQPWTEVGDRILLGGDQWQIISIQHREKSVEVAKCDDADAPSFIGTSASVHDRVRDRMRAIYNSDQMPMYLDSEAGELLAEGRRNFRRLQLHQRDLISDGARGAIWFPWIGDAAMLTLRLMLSPIVKVHRAGVALVFPDDAIGKVVETVERLLSDLPSALQLGQAAGRITVEKHDHYVPDDLLAREVAVRYLDIAGAKKALFRVAAQHREPE